MGPIELNAILIEDKQIGGYTAYLERYPNVISEGETIEEAVELLKGAFMAMIVSKINTPEMEEIRKTQPQINNPHTEKLTFCI